MASDRVRSASTASITKQAIGIPASWSEVVDVLLDDQRVFSIAPDRVEVNQHGRRRTPWPPALRKYLHGSTTVTLRAHVSGEVLAREDLRFDSQPGRVHVVDDEGVPLILDKWGALKRPFEAGSPDKAAMLADTAELLAVLNDVVGVPAFIAYGTLLGAVRGGRLIGHDNDVDVAYYSRFEHPADVMRQSFVVQRRLHELGWRSRRRTGAFLQVHKPREDGPGPKIDVFAAYHVNGRFALHKWVRGRLPREAILPLGKVELEGMALPAPHDPEALLALTYGESWRVPDPSFAFSYPPATRRRAEGWFGGWRREKGRWRQATRESLQGRRKPSPFARYVDERLGQATTVLDVGCGIGTDAVWLARDGRRVIGFDFIGNGLARATEKAEARGVPARFEPLNLYELRFVMVTAARLALDEPDVAIYARHLLESLWPEGRANFWLLAKTVLGGGGTLFVEFHTGLAADGSPREVPAPLLQGLDPDEVVAEVTARGGRVNSRDTVDQNGRGVCRLSVSFTR